MNQQRLLALDEVFYRFGNAHIRPVGVACFDVDNDTVGMPADGHDGPAVGAIRIHRMNAAGIQLQALRACFTSMLSFRTETWSASAAIVMRGPRPLLDEIVGSGMVLLILRGQPGVGARE
jgi:hypothetical protein